MLSLKFRHMGQEAKYSLLSMLSLAGVLALHLLHWLAAPLMIGAAAEMHAHHHGAEGGGSLLASFIMMLLMIVNAISMYFAVLQLVAAFKKQGSARHKILCSGLSVIVLGMGIYTILSM